MENNKQILGISHFQGEFNNRKYDNYVFFIGYQFSSDNDVNLGIGIILTDKVKMSKERLENFLDSIGYDTVNELLFHYVDEVFYNQYRQGVSFVLKDV